MFGFSLPACFVVNGEAISSSNWISVLIAFFTLLVTVVSIIIACKTLNVASETLKSTERIASNQLWETLIAEYRSVDFGKAVKMITDFFVEDCQKDLANIKKAYQIRFEKENNLYDEEKTLHFARRTLANYYWQLDLCVKQKGFEKTEFVKYFGVNELNLITIVAKMNEAVDNLKIFERLVPEDTEYFNFDGSKVSKANKKYSMSINDYLKDLHEYIENCFDNRGVNL